MTPEICTLAPMQGKFQKLLFLRLFLCKFRKVFNTKVVRLGKTSPTEVESMQSEFVWNFQGQNNKFSPYKISEISDIEIFRNTEFPNPRNTIPTHFKNYFTTSKHLLVQSCFDPRLKFRSGIPFRTVSKIRDITFHPSYKFLPQNYFVLISAASNLDEQIKLSYSRQEAI